MSKVEICGAQHKPDGWLAGPVGCTRLPDHDGNHLAEGSGCMGDPDVSWPVVSETPAPPSSRLTRDEHGKHPFEDQGMEIVPAITRDYLPDMDSNDGGQILTWLIELCDQVAGSPETPAPAGTETLARATDALKSGCDRSWTDETPLQVVQIAANALHYRNVEIAALRQQLREAHDAMAEHKAVERAAIERAREAESTVATLTKDLAANAAMLARQCDLAREAESRLALLIAGVQTVVNEMDTVDTFITTDVLIWRDRLHALMEPPT